MTDPTVGYTYTPPPPAPIYNNPAGDPSTPYVPPTTVGAPTLSGGGAPYGGTGPQLPRNTGFNANTQTQTAGGVPPPSGSSNINWADVFNPPWMGQQSQQWLNFMMGPQGVQFQNQLAQQQEDLQKQIQTAAYTGDWNGVQTLQSKLQDVQVQLAKNQADMNNAIGMGNMTGQYNGHATLQAQQMANQMGLQSGDQSLQARGQDVSYDSLLNQLGIQARGQDVSMAGIQAQLAQSPLVAWYTARGLPPPTSAIMTGPAAWNPITSGPAAWTPTTQTWDYTNQGPPDPLLGSATSPPTPKV